jgi:Predicted integral membrane protein (DUF2269)
MRMMSGMNPVAIPPGVAIAPRAPRGAPGPVGQRPKLLLTLHVLATVGVFGADLVLLVLGLSSLRGAEPRTIYPAARLVAANLVAPLVLVSVGTGLLLGRLTGWGLFRYWWVTLKLAITLVLTLVVLLVLVPRLNAAAAAATGPAAGSFRLAERVPLAVAPAAASSLLAVNVALAIYKPGRRLRRGAGLDSGRTWSESLSQPGGAA